VVREVGRMSFFLPRTVDRSRWSMVRKRRHHRLRTPWGYVGLAEAPGSCLELLAESSLTEMSWLCT
jgi:hypothetical protein